MHSGASASDVFPTGHLVHVPDPIKEYLPASHTLHSSPLKLIVPAAHVMHIEISRGSVILPIGQLSQLVFSLLTCLPKGQSKQKMLPGDWEYFPSSQTSQAELPELEFLYFPGEQNSHSAPGVPENLPKPQSIHSAAPGAFVDLLAGQFTQTARATSMKLVGTNANLGS